MKLDFVHICGFRGFRKPVRLEFSESFTIIEGRNGVGKSTLFDAVEFALTGTISKYLDAKSGRESVADYFWWTGDGASPKERFVEVGFRSDTDRFSIRRTPIDKDELDISAIASRLVDQKLAPRMAITQLCTSTIIRDELITRLSLDMKEGDRFVLLRDAIGAIDAEEWIRKAHDLSSLTSARVKDMNAEAEQAKQLHTNALRQIDQARSALPSTSLIGQATARLQQILDSRAAPDQLPDVARQRMASMAAEIDSLRLIAERFEFVNRLRESLPDLEDQLEYTTQQVAAAQASLEERLSDISTQLPSTALAEQARQLDELVNLGRALGLQDGHCPLCESEVSHSRFEHGLEAALNIARQLDSQAVRQAERERARDAAKVVLDSAEEDQRAALDALNAAKDEVQGFDQRLTALSISEATLETIREKLSSLERDHQLIASDVRLISTFSLDRAIARASAEIENAIEQIGRAEIRLGKARLAEARAKAIYDAARRAAAETLDQRLDRVLPLMSELYKRLRPHPLWNDIEYSVRGDVRRFLKLQVGDDINPQFVFSSGQRRATGLAFLLSVNLSIAWSRWLSILLDDPVQHVDDFRTVHLAEVLSQLCRGGRQIVCAVEDSALAELMCRRLPSSDRTPGKHVTLGTDNEGDLAVRQELLIPPLHQRTLVLSDKSLSA